MKYTHKELAIIFNALSLKSPNEQRSMPVPQLAVAVSAINKLVDLSEDEGKTIPEGEYDVEFSTVEKAMVLGFINDREWIAADGESVISLTEKLS